ncbi:MAG: transposase, partial [Deltaproteobacteria bacterium]|nr:transposase [Deltaproteobacteria bacterium]
MRSTNLDELYRLSDFLVNLFIQLNPEAPRSLMLDLDATDDPTHGQQQLTFFHGFYGQYMYHPLLIFDGATGF